MKKIKYFALLAFVAIAFVSCNKDDDNNNDSSKNSFSYDGKTYKIKAGLIENDGSYGADSSTDFYISLVTTGIKKDSDGDFEPTVNKFSIVSFDLYSSNSNDVKKGTYTFTEEGEEPFDFYGECIFDVKYDNEDSGQYFEVTSGKVTILKNGNPYELKFDLTLENGKKVSGYYKGMLEYQDDSDDYGKPEKVNMVQKHRTLFKH